MDFEIRNFPFKAATPELINEDALVGIGHLSEAEKEEMIFRYKDAEERRKKKRKDIILEKDDFDDILSGPGIG